MAEFISKKIATTIPVPIIIESKSDTLPLLAQTINYLTKCIEVEQDFVTHSRSSQTKTMWIGIGLAVVFVGIAYLMVRKIL